MPNCKSVYDPKEDSTLLERYVRQYAKGSVLDIGTGSGIQAIAAAQSSKVNSVIAIDVQKPVIEHCKKNIKNKKITFLVSDLFHELKKNKNLKNKKFDTITFNPPYLPNELKVKDLTLEGGKKGYETLEKFFNDVNDFLKTDGITLIVFSSLTKKEKVDKFIFNNLLEFKLLEKQHYFFEDLYVYLIKKSQILKKLDKLNIKKIKYFAKGKRGVIFTGNYKNKKIAIKTKNPNSKAIARAENEINFLRILNKKNIGPKLLLADKDFLVYEFVKGIPILDFFEKISTAKSNGKNKKTILKLIKNILEQLFIMDKLKINKEEMSHPQKHILIGKKVVLIDFERAHFTIKPGNVTQFCDFLMSKKLSTLLKTNKITIDKKNIIKLSKTYKKNINKTNLKKILDEIE